MSVHNPKAVVIAIDTESYAGNFEREMCAWLTGRTGECGVGEDLAEEAREQLKNKEWFDKYVVDESDEGCYRPCAIWPTPGWFNNGMGGHYKIGSPEADNADADSKKAFVDYQNHHAKNIVAMLESGEYSNGWTEDKCKDYLDTMAKNIESFKAMRAPAYMSVAIFTSRIPPDEVVSEIRERIMSFADVYDAPRVTGIRVLKPRDGMDAIMEISI